MKNPRSTKQAVAVYDLHYPKHDPPTVSAIFSYVKKNPPDIFIFGGDQFHFDCISHHTKSTPLYRTRRSYKNDIEGFDRDVLIPLERLLPRGCKKIWIIGNHERFEWDLIEEHPELEDAINHIKLLRLEERGWEIIPLGHTYRLGKLNVCHGEIVSGVGNQGPIMTARKALDLYAGNVLCGHTHSPQMFTKTSPVHERHKWQGYVSPIAGHVNPEYLRNRPTSWVNGFTIIDIISSGQFNVYLVNIIDGRFAFGGKVYDAT